MFIDLEKFKNGQLYSKSSWNTETRKESIYFDADDNKVVLIVANKDDKTWVVTEFAYGLNNNILSDDFIEVADPLHFGSVPNTLINKNQQPFTPVYKRPLFSEPIPTLVPPFTVTC